MSMLSIVLGLSLVAVIAVYTAASIVCDVYTTTKKIAAIERQLEMWAN